MNINELSDEEKSVMLARLCNPHLKATTCWSEPRGFNVYAYSFWDDARFIPRVGTVTSRDRAIVAAIGNLYHPDNIALARRVHLWTNEVAANDNDSKHQLSVAYYEWWQEQDIWNSENWQRDFLDKILSLAIEAELTAVSEGGQ